MKLNSIYSTNLISHGRLLKEDILRLPSKETNKPDFYQPSLHINKGKNDFWKNFFTALTFGVTGLYIAHRHNLFNPIKREAKKIIRNSQMQLRVKKFVNKTLSKNTYKEATIEFLKAMSKDKTRRKIYMEEAKKILGNKKSFNQLFEKVCARLSDDKDPASLKRGYVVDVLDNLEKFIEKTLMKNKAHGLPYKNQGQNLMSSVFIKAGKNNSPAEQILHNIIANRSTSTIEAFVKDSIIKSSVEQAIK